MTKLTVVFANGDHVPAHVVAYNIAADVGILKVDNYSKLPPPLSSPTRPGSSKDSGRSPSASRFSSSKR